MLVKDLIEQLQKNYKLEDELIVDYWDKEIVESYNPGMVLTDEQFAEVAERYSNGEYYFQSLAASTFVELAEEVLEEEER